MNLGKLVPLLSHPWYGVNASWLPMSIILETVWHLRRASTLHIKVLYSLRESYGYKANNLMEALDFQKLLIWVNWWKENMLHKLGTIRAAAKNQASHSLGVPEFHTQAEGSGIPHLSFMGSMLTPGSTTFKHAPYPHCPNLRTHLPPCSPGTRVRGPNSQWSGGNGQSVNIDT